jgi:CheY-like chemotaxis protein
LELALDIVPDVVLLDISMPVLDGFGLAAALRADERTRDLPLIFVSAEADPLIKAKAFETGAHGFITKPFDPRVISSFIHRLLAHAVPSRTLRVVDGLEGQERTSRTGQGVGRRVVVGQHRDVLGRDGGIRDL